MIYVCLNFLKLLFIKDKILIKIKSGLVKMRKYICEIYIENFYIKIIIILIIMIFMYF